MLPSTGSNEPSGCESWPRRQTIRYREACCFVWLRISSSSPSMNSIACRHRSGEPNYSAAAGGDDATLIDPVRIETHHADLPDPFAFSGWRFPEMEVD